MKKPVHATINLEKRTSRLYFADDGVDNPDEWIEMSTFMRGGIFFPERYEKLGHQETLGFIVVCGRDVETGIVYVWEQQPFLVITDLLDDENRVEFRGITQFLNRSWSKYFCKTFFWSQDKVRHKHYLLEILREPMVNPKPTFIEGRIDIEDALQSVWTLAKTARLRFPSGSTVHQELEAHQIGEALHPAVHALACAVGGLGIYDRSRQK